MDKKELKQELVDLATKKNHKSDIYDFEVVEDKNGDIVLIDHTEESYYEDWMLKDFNKAVEKHGCYLECECPGRYIVTQ